MRNARDDAQLCAIRGHQYGELVNADGFYVCTECGKVDTEKAEDDWLYDNDDDDDCANK
jgi:hypothetical protein